MVYALLVNILLRISILSCHDLAKFNSLENLYLSTQTAVYATSLGPFGDIGAYNYLHVSPSTQFASIKDKKSIPKNQCEKH